MVDSKDAEIERVYLLHVKVHLGPVILMKFCHIFR